MKSFRNRRRVPFTAADMFALVKDVESYPQFVPLCEGLRVRKRSNVADGIDIIIAEMQVGFKAICERFTSRVTCDSNKQQILVEYIDGPFRKLENRWSFHDEPPTDGGEPSSIVDFYINYEFRNRALGLVMGAMFDSAFHKYADAFVKRAGEIYGRR
jgi:coenzyme Q-binding protein COQ10